MKRTIWFFALLVMIMALFSLSWMTAAQAQANPLTIANLDQMDAAYYAFAAEHPGIPVKLLDRYMSDKQILEAVMTRSDAVDIYCMFVNEGAYAALLDRGFLGAMDELLPFTKDMLPQIRSCIEREGHLVALPYEFSASGGFTYDAEAMGKLELSEDDLPQTWSELFDLLNTWVECYSKSFPEISPFPPSQMQELKPWLFYRLYNEYCTYLDSLEEVPSFDTALFNRLLTSFEAVDFDLLQSVYGEGYDWLEGKALLGQNDDVGFVAVRESANVPFPLALEAGVGPYYGATLSVYIINPFTKNRDAAIAYLSAAARHMDVYTRYSLVPGEAVPTRGEDYEAIRDNFKNEIALLKQQLDAAEGSQKTDLQLRISELENRWARVDEKLWTVNDELIARYQAQVPAIVVYQNGMIGGFEGTGDDGVHSAIARYLSGQMARGAFLAQLDQKVSAMILEGR